jgi:hypothetical protein
VGGFRQAVELVGSQEDDVPTAPAANANWLPIGNRLVRSNS